MLLRVVSCGFVVKFSLIIIMMADIELTLNYLPRRHKAGTIRRLMYTKHAGQLLLGAQNSRQAAIISAIEETSLSGA
jgi:hypothetical protein